MDPEAQAAAPGGEEEEPRPCSCFMRAFYILKFLILFNTISLIIKVYYLYISGFFYAMHGGKWGR